MSDATWVQLDTLEQPNFRCTIHDMNAADCWCAPIEEWDAAHVDPYRQHPPTGVLFARLAMWGKSGY